MFLALWPLTLRGYLRATSIQVGSLLGRESAGNFPLNGPFVRL